jgi:hypothetical protein
MTRSQGGLVSGFNNETVTCIDNLVPSEQLARALGEALESSPLFILNVCLVSPSVCTLPYPDVLLSALCPSYYCSVVLLLMVSVEQQRGGLELGPQRQRLCRHDSGT